MTSPVEILLAKLDRVRKAGDGWSACCPAHKDRSASLSIGIGADGRVLLHCFAGCHALDVVQAIGLTIADLFPERPRGTDSPEDRRRRRMAARQHQWASAIPLLEFESRIVLIAAGDILAGRPLSDGDAQRLRTAVERIEAARAELNPADVRGMLRDLERAGVAG